MLEFIDGMFAFAILDKRTRKIILARDRAGKKPLYLYKKGSKLLFASELNALKAITNLEINEEDDLLISKKWIFSQINHPL